MALADKTRDELSIERDWLRARVRDLGSWSSDQVPVGGPAANAIVEHALGGEAPAHLPQTSQDLEACLNVVQTAPAHLRRSLEEDVAYFERATDLVAQPTPPGPREVSLSDFADSLLQAAKAGPEGEILAFGTAQGVSGQRASEDFARPDYDPDPLIAEWQWLRQRARLCGLLLSEGMPPRRWGRSSNALVDYLLGGPYPSRQAYPNDASDLAACELAVADAPPHLQGKGRWLLDEYRTALRPELSDEAPPSPDGPAAAPPDGPALGH